MTDRPSPDEDRTGTDRADPGDDRPGAVTVAYDETAFDDPHASEPHRLDTVPLIHRLQTRLALLILAVVAVLAGATAIQVTRAFEQARVGVVQLTQAPNGEATPAPGAAAQPPAAEAGPSRLDLRAIVRSTLINLAAVFLFTLVGATVFARGLLTEPIAVLVRGTRELAAGDLGVTLPVTARSELGLLAHAFNDMSGALAARTHELVTTNQALSLSEARYQLALEGANDGLWDWDVTTGQVYYSPRWAAMLGLAESALEPTLASWEDRTHPDDRPALGAALGAHVTGAAPTFQLEHRLRHADGRWLWVLARGAALRGPDGRALRMAGSITDITERVEALALLERRVAERTEDLAALLELSNSTALTLELDPLLAQILERLEAAVGCRGATVYEAALPPGPATEAAAYDPAQAAPGTAQADATAEAHDPVEAALGAVQADGTAEAHDPAKAHHPPAPLRRIAGRGDEPPAEPALLQAALGSRRTQQTGDPPGSLLAVPLVVRDAAVGVLALRARPGADDDERRQLAYAFANQLGVALENGRLYRQVQERAASEERQHLARELHDSVNQALYAILLGTHTAQRKLEASPDDARQALDYVETLAQAGIKEMRALIFVLRPESLEEEGLLGVLRKQLDVLETRHDLATVLDAPAEPDAPLGVKQALSRIAQEALHNVVKHAHARRVRITVRANAGRLRLSVADDGEGFDAGADFPGHLGLRSMEERARAVGGRLELRSAPGEGTTVTVEAPAAGGGDAPA